MSREDVLAVIRRVIQERTETRIARLDTLADALEIRANIRDAWVEITDARLDLLTALIAAETRFRTKIITLPQIVPGANQVTVTWDTAFTTDDYGISATVEAPNAALTKLLGGVKVTTRTTDGFTAIVTNTSVVNIAAGALLHVLGWRTP